MAIRQSGLRTAKGYSVSVRHGKLRGMREQRVPRPALGHRGVRRHLENTPDDLERHRRRHVAAPRARLNGEKRRAPKECPVNPRPDRNDLRDLGRTPRSRGDERCEREGSRRGYRDIEFHGPVAFLGRPVVIAARRFSRPAGSLGPVPSREVPPPGRAYRLALSLLPTLSAVEPPGRAISAERHRGRRRRPTHAAAWLRRAVVIRSRDPVESLRVCNAGGRFWTR